MAIAALTRRASRPSVLRSTPPRATGYPVIIQHAECHDDITPLDVPWVPRWSRSPSVRPRRSACTSTTARTCPYMRSALALTAPCRRLVASPTSRTYRQLTRATAMCASFDWPRVRTRQPRARATWDGAAATEAVPVRPTPTPIRRWTWWPPPASTSSRVFSTCAACTGGEPQLSFEVLDQIASRVEVPLVMHGGSACPTRTTARPSMRGLRKINYYTYGVKYAARRSATSSTPTTCRRRVLARYEPPHRAARGLTQVIRVFANGAEPARLAAPPEGRGGADGARGPLYVRPPGTRRGGPARKRGVQLKGHISIQPFQAGARLFQARCDRPRGLLQSSAPSSARRSYIKDAWVDAVQQGRLSDRPLGCQAMVARFRSVDPEHLAKPYIAVIKPKNPVVFERPNRVHGRSRPR